MTEDSATAAAAAIDRRAGDDTGLPLRTAARIIRLNLRDSLLAHLRCVYKRHQWRADHVRPGLAQARVVVIMVVKDEMPRLEFIRHYYRRLGADHFIVVDNGSHDGGSEYLSAFADVSLFSASGSFGDARYGTDWVNAILRRYCVGKWILWVDADEVLVFSPRAEATLAELATTLEHAGRRSLQTILIDMYSARRPSDNVVRAGTDPLAVCDLFDRSGYQQTWSKTTRTAWIKGGVRGRLFFDEVDDGPALNKTPFVKWRRHYVFLKVAHQLWPRSLNGSTRLGGALLHFKFTDATAEKMTDPDNRAQHTLEYTSYDAVDRVDYRGPATTSYVDPAQLRDIGLIEPWL